MTVLIDADFLVALLKEVDTNHRKAIEKYHYYRSISFVTTPFTIPEVATVLSNRVSHTIAKKFVVEARSQPYLEIFLSQELIAKTDQIFLSQSKKGISWIDCFNVAVIKTYQLDGILSFDSFYRKQSVKVF